MTKEKIISAKQFLGRAWQIEKQIRRLEELRVRAKANAMRGTGGNNAIRYGGTSKHSKVETGVCDYISLGDEINRMVDELIDVKRQIAAVIMWVPNKTHRDLLMMRHVKLMAWYDIASRLRVTAHYAAHELYEMAVKSICSINT